MRLVVFAIVVLLSFSCEKLHEFDPSEFTDEVLVVNGTFSEHFEYQYLQIDYATTINSEEQRPCSTATIELNGLTETYTFSHQNNGAYKSDIPFALTPGANYTLNILNNNLLSSANIKMSSPFLIDSGYTVDYYNMHLSINSAIGQYMTYKCYYADTSEISIDTVWTEINMSRSIYQKTSVGHEEIYLEGLNNQYSILTMNPLLKIVVYSMSNDVGDYLKELEQYSLLSSSSSPYRNPPAYFSNDTYGLVYGTTVDSVIFQVKY